MEVLDQNGNGFVDHGFGTFIVLNSATRQLSHQAVHPIADSTTESQAVTVFKETDSRSYLMAGTHRDANSAASMCRPSHPQSDASHNSNTMVQATNEELLAYYGAASWFAIQWHGMAASTCPNTDVIHLMAGMSHRRPPTRSRSCATTCWCIIRPGTWTCPDRTRAVSTPLKTCRGACSTASLLNASAALRGRAIPRNSLTSSRIRISAIPAIGLRPSGIRSPDGKPHTRVRFENGDRSGLISAGRITKRIYKRRRLGRV